MIIGPWRFVIRSVALLLFCLVAAAGIFLSGFALAGPSTRDQTGSLEVGGRTREYRLHVPPGYHAKASLPLVLVLHGAIQSAHGAERMSGMSAMADQENFLALYPSGTGLFPTWNSGNCCGYALRNNVDDVQFLRALIAKIQGAYSIDPKRIFVTGISNGGMMSYRAACELTDQIAAIAPVEGAQNLDCHPNGPVSVAVFHGTADRMVPFDGGTSPFRVGSSSRGNTPTPDAVAFWVKQDGCSPTPRHEEQAVLSIDAYAGCSNGAAVILYKINGGRHAWPGSLVSRNNVPATSLIWQFFAAHPKP